MHDPHQTRVIVGMSGGVDSAVTALLLKEQGYLVEGLFMKNWEGDDEAGECSAETDLADARAVAARIDIPLHTVNFSAEYWDKVFSYFLLEYKSGRTPNPDILCNKEIKFKAFLDHALSLGADFIATGHYVRSRERDGLMQLLKGRDPNKDQSYFLYTLGQKALCKSLFPVGDLQKTKVRELADSAALPNHNKKDSTGICFIGERKFKAFLSEYLLAQPGVIETMDGEVIGEHDGLMYYTLGQRQGLQIGGRSNAADMPWYVLDKDIKRNVLLVGQGHEHPWLYSQGLVAKDLHWVAGEPPAEQFECRAKTRYRQLEQPCLIRKSGDGTWDVMFCEKQWAITPGQSVVFYQAEVCLGGGVIESIIR